MAEVTTQAMPSPTATAARPSLGSIGVGIATALARGQDGSSGVIFRRRSAKRTSLFHDPPQPLWTRRRAASTEQAVPARPDQR